MYLVGMQSRQMKSTLPNARFSFNEENLAMLKHVQWQLRCLLFLSYIVLQGCATGPSSIEENVQNEIKKSRTFTVLSINDVYRIEGLQSGVGGLSRVRTLRKKLEETYPDLLMLHGGDFLFPSLLSRKYSGEQMIDVLNMMDGVDPGFDPRMFVVFGNHEFDKKKINHWSRLNQRIHESDFRWLGTNVRFKPGYEVTSNNVADHYIIEVGGIKVGIFGLTKQTDDIAFATILGSADNLKKIALAQTKELRTKGAEFVIALTHLKRDADVEILKLENGPDMIIGGHDHFAVNERVNNRCLFKSDADAKSARVTRVTISAESPPIISSDLIRLPPDLYEADPVVDKLVNDWLHRHERYFEKKYCKSEPGCLKNPYVKTETRLIGEEVEIRSQESNLGNWVADKMLEVAKNSGKVPNDATVIAIINSGALRLNQNLDAGTDITRRIVEELIQYNDPLYLLPVTPDNLKIALDHSVFEIKEGPWLQIAGFKFKANLTTKKASDIFIGEVALEQIDDDKLYVIMPKYIAAPDADGDQDRYKFEGNDKHKLNVKLRDAVIHELEKAEANIENISPQIEGRIVLTNVTKTPHDECKN
jgi:2',3'-cyclic-nucleotide 2'-phosphodiesterase (5'-nucleotidase family)